MTRQEMVAAVFNSKGRIFSVEFTKRSNGELRRMSCRTGVSKGVKGVGASYEPEDYDLLRVYDMTTVDPKTDQRGVFRMIPVEGVHRIHINGEYHEINDAQGHVWEQCGHCLNGPHLWQCKKCSEWTRAYDKPKPDAVLIDPDNGHMYSGSTSKCRSN